MIAAVIALSLAAAPTQPGATVWAELQSRWRPRLEPLLSEALRFPTVHGDQEALRAQRQWLVRLGPELGFVVHDRETMTEIDLPGPEGAPVLGLVVHGDLQPVNASEWSVPPFSGAVKDGAIWGRGAADDKGPMIQALLAMAALGTSGLARTHTVRLLVGTDEEGGGSDIDAYRKAHRLPDASLVLDSDFPVVIGEKAWAEWIITADERTAPASGPVEVVDLEAGIAVSIVPDRAALKLRWRSGTPDWERWLAPVRATRLPQGTSLEISGDGAERLLVVRGRAAHAGIALGQGRNALVALGVAVHGRLPPCAAADLLEYARDAGADTRGRGLGLRLDDPLWGGVNTNFGQVTRGDDGRLALHVNLRSPPSLWGEALKARVDAHAKAFAARTGARFETGGQFGYEPFAVPANAPLVQRLMAAYARGTGRPGKPVVSAGGTYASRMTNAVAFGMWFREDGPYPGHSSEERVQVRSLEHGMHVLAEALGDLATGPKIERPLEAPPATKR
jgi:succinyl-diaminopimelate desuccinylase